MEKLSHSFRNTGSSSRLYSSLIPSFPNKLISEPTPTQPEDGSRALMSLNLTNNKVRLLVAKYQQWKRLVFIGGNAGIIAIFILKTHRYSSRYNMYCYIFRKIFLGHYLLTLLSFFLEDIDIYIIALMYFTLLQNQGFSP